MRFQPMDEKEISEANLWPVGEYDFQIFDASDEVSKAGNEMIKLTVDLFNDQGERRRVFDYLIASNNGMFKVLSFADAVGLREEYDRGDLQTVDIHQRTGRCKVGVQKDKTGQYPDKNGIMNYIKADAGVTRANQTRSAPPAARTKVAAGTSTMKYRSDAPPLRRGRVLGRGDVVTTPDETRRRTLALVAEIDPYELAVRLAEVEMGMKRPPGLTPKQILGQQSEEFQAIALRMAAAAAEYITECINAGREPS